MSAYRLRGALAELVAIIQRHGSAGIDDFDVPYVAAAMTRARALLAEAQPGSTPEPVREGPTYRDVLALRDQLDDKGLGTVDLVAFALVVLQRWGCPAPEPVSVAERRPTASDCDAEGWCWMYEQDGVWWQVLIDAPCVMPQITHWLPHWALPVPKEQDNG